jgi:hypothetical protein
MRKRKIFTFLEFVGVIIFELIGLIKLVISPSLVNLIFSEILLVIGLVIMACIYVITGRNNS